MKKIDIMKWFGTMKELPSFDEIEKETDGEDQIHCIMNNFNALMPLTSLNFD